jgi:hypothetical protein
MKIDKLCGWFLVFSGIWLVGCGDSGQKFKLVPVHGTVTQDGKPLADAQVQFFKQGDIPEGFPGTGAKTDAQGKYEVMTGAGKGAIPGSYKITVSKLLLKNGTPLVESDGIDKEQLIMQGQVVESVPKEFSDAGVSKLIFDVAEGKADGYDIKIGK